MYGARHEGKQKGALGELMHSLGTGEDGGMLNKYRIEKGVSRIQQHYFMAQFRALSRGYGALDMNLLRPKSKGIEGYMV